MTPPRFLSLLLLPLASLTCAGPLSARFRFNETSLAEPLDGRPVFVADGVLEKRAPPRPGQPRPGTSYEDPMDIDAPGPSQPRPGVAAGGATVIDPQQEASTRPKGKDKATADEKELIKYYETLGRTVFNAWLHAPDTASSNQLMTELMGPDPRNENWQRVGVVQAGLRSLRWTWSGIDADKTSELAQRGGLGRLESALSELRVGTSAIAQDWKKLRNIHSKLYVEPSFEGPNLYFEFTQNLDWGEARYGKSMATNAEYHTTFNLVDGVIIIHKLVHASQDWLDAKAAQPDTINKPSIHTWSDLTWVTWHRLRMKPSIVKPLFKRDPETPYPFFKISPSMDYETLAGPAKKWLNWIIVVDIVDEHTIDIMKQCFAARGVNGIPLYQNHQAFGVGHWCFYALLATQSSNVIAEFPAQHRDDIGAHKGLGHQMLASVVLFGTQDSPSSPIKPALAWSVSDDQATVQTWMSAFEADWVCHVDEENFEYTDVAATGESKTTPPVSSLEGSPMEESTSRLGKSKRNPPTSQPGHDSASNPHSAAPNSSPGSPKGTVQLESSTTKPNDPPEVPSIPDDDKPFGWLLYEIELPESLRNPDLPIVANSRPAPASKPSKSKPDAENAGRKLESRQIPPVNIPAGTEDQHRWAWEAYQANGGFSRSSENRHRLAMMRVENLMAQRYPDQFSNGIAAMPACNVWVREGKTLLGQDLDITALDTSMLTADLDALWGRILELDKSDLTPKKQADELLKFWQSRHLIGSQNQIRATLTSIRSDLRWRMEGRTSKVSEPTPGHIPSPRYSAAGPAQAVSILQLAYAAQGRSLPEPQAAPPAQAGPASQPQAAAPEAGPSMSRHDRNVSIIQDMYCQRLQRMNPDGARRDIASIMQMIEPWRTQRACDEAVQSALEDFP